MTSHLGSRSIENVLITICIFLRLYLQTGNVGRDKGLALIAWGVSLANEGVSWTGGLLSGEQTYNPVVKRTRLNGPNKRGIAFVTTLINLEFIQGPPLLSN